MWTNVYKIGGFHQISWFQFLPHESDLNPLPDKSLRLDQKDASTLLVLSSHLQLQKEGFLSTWTNSFVGPWDPSQGLHNPDEKIKLWLFLPGRHTAVVEPAQAAVSKLRVVASGVWLAPGVSEEIAAALSQALRNCIERAFKGLSYMRFGDVLSRFNPITESEEFYRRGQPTVEFVFAATEEAIFVHVIISAKHMRALSSGDMERLTTRFSNSSEKLPVIVSPHGMSGRLTGCSPSDLVKQVYFSSSKFRTSNGFIGLANYASQGSFCQLRGQNCYAEVTLGCHGVTSEKAFPSNSNPNQTILKHHISESSERTFIYPAEGVIVLVPQTSVARSFLKRFWLQNWIGPSCSVSSFFNNGVDFSSAKLNAMDGSWIEANESQTRQGYNSSSNSNSSSLSSISSASSDNSDYKNADLEADADSLTCRQSVLSSLDQIETDYSKVGSKRSRTGLGDSNGAVNEQVVSHWDWDDDDRGMGMEIQALLSAFGDFGDFFENDTLPFGEPPGTAESQSQPLMFSSDCGDLSSSPCPTVMDMSDQLFLPVGFSSFDSFNPPPPPMAVEEPALSKNQEITKDTLSSGPVMSYAPTSTGEFDHIIKAEALMTFAPEFGAIETPKNKASSIFTNPYMPKSRKAESSSSSPSLSPNNYVYGPKLPTSPHIDGLDEKFGMHVKSSQGCPTYHSKKYYTHVENSGEQHHNRNLLTCNKSPNSSEPIYSFNSTNAVKSAEERATDGTLRAEQFLFSAKTVLATEVECTMFQAYMCRIRHLFLSLSGPSPTGLSWFTEGTVLNHLPVEPSTMKDNLSSKYELKKKEIPVRIAGAIDEVMLDEPVNAPVGVWRSVGVTKSAKPTNTSPGIEVVPSLSHNSFNEDGLVSYGQRQSSLIELLDGLGLLVQQATSFVDMALDAECGDGPYGLLALQEQWRRGFSCGPSMVHAGCGGILASGHSLDIAGVELLDPFSADVHASSVLDLLQSDIRTALKSAFGILDGPLSVTDWCKGRSQSSDALTAGDGFAAESTVTECRDSSNTVTLSIGEPISPSQSSGGGSSCPKGSNTGDGTRLEDRRTNQEISNSESPQQLGSRLKPTLFVLPLPAVLVGYQDDWLKTSTSSLQIWEKAPLEPYAMQKPMIYYVICPDIDPLTTAAADFFQQLGTVYETCKLGTHTPQNQGNQVEIASGKLSSSGFVLVDCPQSMKIESSNASLVGSISDYLLSLSNGWDLTSFIKSLSKVIRALKLGSSLTVNPKEGNNGPCTVIYVVCPFPDPSAVLQTVIESSVSIGSTILSSDKDKRSILQSQVVKALSCSTSMDELSTSTVLTLSGFTIPKVVLQIVTVDAIFRVTSPSLSELVILKETAFTVYNKARRISRGFSNDAVHSSSVSSSRPNSVLMQMNSPVSGMWKGELDASLRPTWDNSWQTPRTGGFSCDPNRLGDVNNFQDEIRFMFEPLFILAEPGSLEHGVSPTFFNNLASESSKDDSLDTVPSGQFDGSEGDGHQKALPSLHCCYGWTEDWRWLVSIWTDSKGELLDCYIYPFGGISSRQDTKGLQCLFVQILQQGCQILQACSSPDTGVSKPRDIVVTRIGCFYELEYQEWQKAIFMVGGSEVKKWPVQLRRSMPDGMPANSNITSLQQQEISLIQERTLPSSPNPLYSSHSKASGFIKSSMGQPAMRKQLMSGGHPAVDGSRGLLQWVQSISLVSVCMDHSLQLIYQSDSSSPGAPSSYLEGFTPVRSLGATSASYVLIPSPSMRFLPPSPLQIPTCLTAESPPLAHLLHSKGSAIPLSTGFVVSKSVPSMRKDCKTNSKEEWPSVLSVSLVDYFGGGNSNNNNSSIAQEKMVRGNLKQGGRGSTVNSDEIETHLILETVSAELHALSWMTVSPAYLERRTALPFHCDMVLRLRRLLHFAEKELSQH